MHEPIIKWGHLTVAVDPEPAETKSDPKTERIVAEALDSFWYQATNNNARYCMGKLSNDVRVRLEIAAYDAVEEWRAENPPR